MDITKQEIHKVFGHQLRLRISGICIENESILLVKHLSVGEKGILWAPPGGGLHYGETIEETLKREFEEETGLLVQMGQPLLINEYMEHPLHAVELFFEVHPVGGVLKKGYDPELGENSQIIQEVRFVPFEEISLSDPTIFHSMFRGHRSVQAFQHFLGFHQNITFRKG